MIVRRFGNGCIMPDGDEDCKNYGPRNKSKNSQGKHYADRSENDSRDRYIAFGAYGKWTKYPMPAVNTEETATSVPMKGDVGQGNNCSILRVYSIPNVRCGVEAEGGIRHT